MSASLLRLVTESTRSGPLAVVRILVGAAAIAKALDFHRVLVAVLGPDALRIPRFSWLPELPLSAVPWLLTVWIVSALALAIGWRTRLAGWVLTCVLGYVLLLDHQLFGNNLYLLALVVFLLSLADSGACLSVDARLRGTRDSVPAWPVHLLKLQLSIVYGFAALAKFNIDFLSGSVMASVTRLGLVPIPDSWRIFPLMAGASIAAVLVEVFLAGALWSSRLRVLAVLFGVALHAGIVLFTGAVVELTIFAVITMSLYILFFDIPVSRKDTAAGAPRRTDWNGGLTADMPGTVRKAPITVDAAE